MLSGETSSGRASPAECIRSGSEGRRDKARELEGVPLGTSLGCCCWFIWRRGGGRKGKGRERGEREGEEEEEKGMKYLSCLHALCFVMMAVGESFISQ